MSDAQQETPGPDGARPAAEAPVVKPVLTPAQAKRANSTIVGMLMAVGGTLAVVVPVVLINPTHTADTYQRNVDVEQVAAQAAGDAGYEPAAPELPEDWSSNFARWTTGTSDGVDFWEVGYLTAGNGFIQFAQTVEGNPSWTAQQAGPAQLSGERSIGGVEWELRDASNGDTVLTSEVDGSTLVLSGEADLAEFDVLAEAVLADLEPAPPAAEAP
ncbi:DUF4245 domain-containing protein [Arthrobacter sp. TMN-37]